MTYSPSGQPAWGEPVAAAHCYEHPDRVAGAVCRRCGRPICPDCMREAPVGWQCRSCVKEAARVSPVVRWRPSGSRGAGGRLGMTRLTPVVVALIAVNVAVFVWEEASFDSVVNRFAMWPAGVHYRGEWYRVITGAFLHANAEHILFNMVTLAIVGPAVEAELGRVRFLLLYLLAAVGGSVGSYLFSPLNTAGVGASGAIFGVMGAYAVLARRRGWEIQTILALIGINLLLGFTSTGIDWRAHIGGLTTGVVTCLAMEVGLRRSVSDVAVLVRAAAVTVAVGAGLGLLLQLPPG